MRNTRELIDEAGGIEAVAKALGLSPWGVRRWLLIGIHPDYWRLFMRAKVGATPAELYAAMMAVRNPNRKRSRK